MFRLEQKLAARPLLFLSALAALAISAGFVDSRLGSWRGHSPSGLEDASWLWLERAARRGEPLAFFAARDVELAGPGAFRLTVAADESYVLWVNGRPVGSGVWQGQADIYDLSEHLDGGWNRLMIELRSERGAGGFIAGLSAAGQEAPVLVSDHSWRLFEKEALPLLRGHRRLEDLAGKSPVAWNGILTGRWRFVGETRRPTFDRAQVFDESCPRRVRYPTAGSVWSDLDGGCVLPALGEQVIFDFGETVEGFLEIGQSANATPALIYFGLEDQGLVPPHERRPDWVMVPLMGAETWRDAEKRRFRYLAIYGWTASARVAVLPSPAGWPVAADRHDGGVFGLRPARAATRIEEEIWNRLRGR